MKTADVIIIGAGPAGLFAAMHCIGAKVIVLEKNASAGRKLLISGTGRCNLTHDCKLNDFFAHYGENQRFLKTPLHSFSNTDVIHFFKDNGLQTVTDKNGKVFPSSQKATDVLDVLIKVCQSRKVEITYNQRVEEVKKTESGFAVKTERETFSARNLVIASGGMSYPATGSTGDGYHLAKQLGHSVIPPKPSLSPVFIRDYGMASISGVSLQQKMIYLYRGDKKVNQHCGNIGFTHKGLSGPGILDFSRFILNGDTLKLNLINQNPDEFRNDLITSLEKEGRTAIQTYLKKFNLPHSLVHLILQNIRILPESRLAEISKAQRTSLVSAFCELPFVVERVGGFSMAMVTAGGVSLQEVNAKTMESKLHKGLYFAGEVLDIDGDTGGYNLQAAFSTGYLAGMQLTSPMG